jgi:hypothetical protein
MKRAIVLNHVLALIKLNLGGKRLIDTLDMLVGYKL